MSMTPLARDWHDKYETWPKKTQRIVDEAFDGVRDAFKSHGVPVRGDDNAEILVSAIAQYLDACATITPKLVEQIKGPCFENLPGCECCTVYERLEGKEVKP